MKPTLDISPDPQSAGEIGISQYAGRHDLTSIVIPDGVRRIDDYAFFGCDNLTDVSLPDSLVEIGEAAFGMCGKLTSLTIPDGVRQIGRRAFASCIGLRSITLPEAFDDLRSDIFPGCESLVEIKAGPLFAPSGDFTLRVADGQVVIALAQAVKGGEVRLPSGVTGIAPGAFALCTGVRRLNIPRTVIEVDSTAFEGLDELEQVTFQEGSPLTFEEGDIWMGYTLVLHVGHEAKVSIRAKGGTLRIGKRAFAACKSLTEVRIEAEAGCDIAIGEMAFEGCESLRAVSLPEHAKVSMGPDVFAECVGLTAFSIPTEMTEIPDGAFANCTGLKEVDMHDEIVSIGSEAFVGCTGLTAIELPLGLRRIGFGAFAWSGLTSVAIPRGAEEVGDFAFSMCRMLEAATMPKAVLTRACDVFAECPRLEIMGTNDSVK